MWSSDLILHGWDATQPDETEKYQILEVWTKLQLGAKSQKSDQMQSDENAISSHPLFLNHNIVHCLRNFINRSCCDQSFVKHQNCMTRQQHAFLDSFSLAHFHPIILSSIVFAMFLQVYLTCRSVCISRKFWEKDYNKKLTSSSMVLVDGSVNVMDDVAYSSSWNSDKNAQIDTSCKIVMLCARLNILLKIYIVSVYNLVFLA